MSKIKNKGVTIVELIITLFVLFTGIIAILSASRQPIEHARISISNFQAYYYAKEGIEIVRNERDNLWLKEESWSSLLIQSETNHLNGLITGTKFNRLITIQELGGNEDIIKVNVNISWTEKGKNYEINVQENLYNWL